MATEKKYTVYIHISPEGKKYVGCTSLKPERRWKNGSGYKQNKEFTIDIKKYGWENFNHEVIIDNLTKEEGGRIERLLIKLYNCYDDRFGYNKDLGGFDSGKCSKCTKEKISKFNVGKILSDETRNKIKLSMTGEKNRYYGKKLSEEHKRKMSENHADFSGKNHPMARPVILVNTGEIFDTAKEAGLCYNTGRAHITACCKGKRNSAGKHPKTGEKLVWEYYIR